MKADHRDAGLPAREVALLDYAVKLTKSPGDMAEDDVQALRRHGWTDEEIHHAAQICAYFNYINRIADGLGVDLEPEMPPRRQP